MTVEELKTILKKFPGKEEVTILFPEDEYGIEQGSAIAEVAYITGSSGVTNGVFIRID